MFLSTTVLPDHKDLIHDVAYDFYGKRIATCSSDQSVKVWDKGDNGQWYCSSSWKTHSGSVWKVAWAHPEFGKILATCSFDRTTAIWEEIVTEGGAERSQTHWVKRYALVDSRGNVADVKFAPKHLGLVLATCSQEGTLRIYEAVDVMNLTQWTFQHEVSVSKLRCSCIAWNLSKYHPPMIAVGSDDSNIAGGKVIIFECNESARKWFKVEVLSSITDPVHDLAFAPNLGRSFHSLAVASRTVAIFTLKPTSSTCVSSEVESGSKFEVRQIADLQDHENAQVWRVSWNITGTILASSGADGFVRLWKANYLDNWKCISRLRATDNAVQQIDEEDA